MPFSGLIPNGHVGMQVIRVFPGGLGKSGVRRYHHQVVHDVHFLYALAQNGQGQEMVHRLFKETLHLRGMQVHGDYAVGARRLDTVRADPRADGDAGFVLLVALRVAEIRNDCGHGVRAGTLECVQPEQ
ncbi:hypothetical protein SDC9_183770 [bioreactor metagenome]|uniref:Uncharacterized protein n=1 Tax=bioreactor metagenome TaxID=1076179 RepID=A0A645HB42_9ZZZZ